jgi:hypothetical protein
MGRRLVGAVLALVAILGMKLYGKGSAHADVKARLVALCGTDSECQADVQRHYDACFDASRTIGGRRTLSKPDTDALVACVNRESGVPYFAVRKE